MVSSSPKPHNGQVGSSCLFENFEILLWSRYVPVAILQCVCHCTIVRLRCNMDVVTVFCCQVTCVNPYINPERAVTLYFPVYVISEPVKGLSGGGGAFVPELYSIFNNRVYKGFL